jgi:hypothetical protein
MNRDVKKYIGRNSDELKNAFGFTHYIETNSEHSTGKNQDHARIVDAFFKLVGTQNIITVKTGNGMIQEILPITKGEIRKQLLLLEHDKGTFYDEDLTISYAFVGERFFAYVLPNTLLFSADQNETIYVERILEKYGLSHTGVNIRPELEEIQPPKVLQLKITLEDIEPKIWRRFVVEDCLSFHDLHKVIQRVMGWADYHAYMFTVGRKLIEGVGGMGFAVDTMWRSFKYGNKKALPATKTMVWEVLDKEGLTFSYVYDWGDMWRHSVVVEKIMPPEERDYPVVLDGARACPPEDCGGVGGYLELLEIQKDKLHPLYRERIMRWLGGPFDPEYFDAAGGNAKSHTDRFPVEKRIKTLKLGRNEPCYCGSGKKYKKCCLEADRKEIGQERKIPAEV